MDCSNKYTIQDKYDAWSKCVLNAIEHIREFYSDRLDELDAAVEFSPSSLVKSVLCEEQSTIKRKFELYNMIVSLINGEADMIQVASANKDHADCLLGRIRCMILNLNTPDYTRDMLCERALTLSMSLTDLTGVFFVMSCYMYWKHPEAFIAKIRGFYKSHNNLRLASELEEHLYTSNAKKAKILHDLKQEEKRAIRRRHKLRIDAMKARYEQAIADNLPESTIMELENKIIAAEDALNAV